MTQETADIVAPAFIRSSNGDVAIRAHSLSKRYESLEAVRGIDLEVKRGEIFGLI